MSYSKLQLFKPLVFLAGIVNLISCKNFSPVQDSCLHISEVNIVDGLILHDGKPYNGVLFEKDYNSIRQENNIKSPIHINGLPDEFKGKIGFAMTVVEGIISGPFATMYLPYDRFNYQNLTTAQKEIMGRYYVYEIDSRPQKLDCSVCYTIKGSYRSGNVRIFGFYDNDKRTFR